MDVSLRSRPGRGCQIVQLAGALDLATVPEVRRSLQDALDGGVRAVVLDLADVPFIDSGALGMMVWLHKQLRQRGGRVCVVAAQPSVRDLFERTSVHRLIAIYDRVELAEADLATSSES